MPTFKRAETPEEIRAVVRLRYDIYVAEMQVYVDKADHERKIFTDAHDETDRMLMALEGDELVGAISIVSGSDVPVPEDLSAIYDLDRFREFSPEKALGAAIRLVTKPEYRGSTLPFQLMSRAVEELVSIGTELLFCTCQPHLLSLYESLGFHSYAMPVYNDPQFGIMVPLVMPMGDSAHLDKIQSPLRSVLAAGSYSLPLERVYEAMGDAQVKTTDSTASADWAGSMDLHESPQASRSLLLEGLDKEETQEVIAHGHLIDCEPGAVVIKKDQVTRTVFVPLSGSLEVRDGNRSIAVIQTGEMLGEVSFLLGGRRTADVVAGPGGAKVLSLNVRNLQRLLDLPGKISTTLWSNISRSLALRLAATTAALGSS